MNLLLTDKERKQIPKGFRYLLEYKEELDWLLEVQLKKALIGVGKEAQRMDGSTYLVPDYHKYRKALEEAGIE